MKVKCNVNTYNTLIKNHHYECVSIEPTLYLIINDFGKHKWYAKYNFTTIENNPMTQQQILDKITAGEHPIRVRGLLKKRKETLKQFLIKFFKTWNDEKDTIYVDTEHEQTEAGKRRSFGDIFLICRYYYPNCTIKEVSTLLYNEMFDNVPRFRSSKCSQIYKRVFYVGEEDEDSYLYQANDNDEFGMTVTNWNNLN